MDYKHWLRAVFNSRSAFEDNDFQAKRATAPHE